MKHTSECSSDSVIAFPCCHAYERASKGFLIRCGESWLGYKLSYSMIKIQLLCIYSVKGRDGVTLGGVTVKNLKLLSGLRRMELQILTSYLSVCVIQ